MKKRVVSAVLTGAVALGTCMYSSIAFAAADQVSADEAIVSVKTIGFVDLEGAKTAALAVEYNVPVRADSVSAESYEITDYATFREASGGYENTIELDYDGVEGNEGQITAVYVNDCAEISADGGKETGNYVIIEVNTEYMLKSQNLAYTETMMGGVRQVADISSENGVITAGTQEISNYTTYEVENAWSHKMETAINADKSMIILPEFGEGSGWTLHYIGENAFQAENCYSEYTGEYVDFELPYAIYVPDQEILEANKGNIALVIHMEHAGANDSDPMAAITSSRAAVKLAGEEVQAENPAIVIVPQIEESRRTTDDYDASSEANVAAWELLDSVIEEYSEYINMDRIYGTGQSMGGMAILYMASQRDNFFGGIAVIGAQWSNSYNKDFQHNGVPARSPENDPVSFNGFGLDEENYLNWYYMISDDNVLVHTCAGDPMATGEWQFLADYFEAAGVTIAQDSWDPYMDPKEQDLLDQQMTDHDNTTPGSGINWGLFTNGNHMSTWKYGYQLTYPFQWLFSQSRQTIVERGKIEQLKNEWLGRDEEGKVLAESGTAGLNAGQFTPRGSSDIYVEGWTPVSATNAQIAAILAGGNAGQREVQAVRSCYELLSEDEKAQIVDYEAFLAAAENVQEEQGEPHRQ